MRCNVNAAVMTLCASVIILASLGGRYGTKLTSFNTTLDIRGSSGSTLGMAFSDAIALNANVTGLVDNINQSESEALMQQIARGHRSKGPDDQVCGDYRDLKKALRWSNESRRWAWVPATKWCGISLPLTPGYLRRVLSGKKIVFAGDSVARNSFVVLMSLLCNFEFMFRCITRLPTYEYDVVTADPTQRGPMGCQPPPKIPTASTTSPCYSEGIFADVPLRGLTVRTVPQDRVGRRAFIRGGLIGPTMNMKYANITLTYLPINRPSQLSRTARWMLTQRQSWIQADAFVVSIGPHLGPYETARSPRILSEALSELRLAVGNHTPIVLAEFVHTIGHHPAYVGAVDTVMELLRDAIRSYGVVLVPQRFITSTARLLRSAMVEKSEEGCGYYDPQHPALMCQEKLSELLVAAILGKWKVLRRPGV